VPDMPVEVASRSANPGGGEGGARESAVEFGGETVWAWVATQSNRANATAIARANEGRGTDVPPVTEP